MNFFILINVMVTALSVCYGFSSNRNQPVAGIHFRRLAGQKQNTPKRRTLAAAHAYVIAQQGRQGGHNMNTQKPRMTLSARVTAHVRRGNRKPNTIPAAYTQLHNAGNDIHIKGTNDPGMSSPKSMAARLFARIRNKTPNHNRRYHPVKAHQKTGQTPQHKVRIHQTIIVNKTTNILPMAHNQGQNRQGGSQAMSAKNYPQHKGHNRNTLNSGGNNQGFNGLYYPFRPMKIRDQIQKNSNNKSPPKPISVHSNGSLSLVVNFHNDQGHQGHSRQIPSHGQSASAQRTSKTHSHTNRIFDHIQHVPRDTRVVNKNMNRNANSKIIIYPNHPSLKQITIQGQRSVIITGQQNKSRGSVNHMNGVNSSNSNRAILSQMWSNLHRQITEEPPEREI